MKFLMKLLKSRKGAALFEYSLLLAGVGLVTIAAVSVFGHKVSDMTAAVATVLPGAHDEDNNCRQGDKVRLIETRPLSRRKRWRVQEKLA